jgi:hypothetical protein
MKVLDQQIALSWAPIEERPHLRQRLWIDLTALGGTPRPPAALRRLANSATL